MSKPQRYRHTRSVGKYGHTLADLQDLVSGMLNEGVPTDARVTALDIGEAGWTFGNLRLHVSWTTLVDPPAETTTETEEPS